MVNWRSYWCLRRAETMMKTTYEYALFLITRFQPWAKLKSAEWTGHIYGASNLMQLYKSRYPGTCVSIKTLFPFYKSRVNPFSKKKSHAAIFCQNWSLVQMVISSHVWIKFGPTPHHVVMYMCRQLACINTGCISDSLLHWRLLPASPSTIDHYSLFPAAAPALSCPPTLSTN